MKTKMSKADRAEMIRDIKESLRAQGVKPTKANIKKAAKLEFGFTL